MAGTPTRRTTWAGRKCLRRRRRRRRKRGKREGGLSHPHHSHRRRRPPATREPFEEPVRRRGEAQKGEAEIKNRGVGLRGFPSHAAVVGAVH